MFPKNLSCKHQPATCSNEPLIIEKFCCHDLHIPGQRVGRYPDISLPGPGRLEFFYEMGMPHFIKLHNDSAAGLGLIIRLLDKLATHFKTAGADVPKKMR